MPKPLRFMIAAVALVWGCTMFTHYAYSDDTVAPAPVWGIQGIAKANDGTKEHNLGWVATDQVHPEKFKTEAECKVFLKTNQYLKDLEKRANEKIAKWSPPGHLELACVKVEDNSI